MLRDRLGKELLYFDGGMGTLLQERGLAPGELPVSALQQALDAYLAARPQVGIDFIHGTDTLRHLSDAAGRIGFLLPDFAKDALFPYVAAHGVLPRKTFSMGTALEKRYYLEARMIRSDR